MDEIKLHFVDHLSSVMKEVDWIVYLYVLEFVLIS